ncbi:hypothetical protein CAEBREN_28881 [Caenorhabditis brenneri]|uniref:MSP domain-containing protein n=1 Tax=Caenorhabditis brenneri TaxID=135651 RepID=G0MZN1_CAEBE|nr:hypothetical protein CAEBREN_28881 [Caenorhabditis brenneri]
MQTIIGIALCILTLSAESSNVCIISQAENNQCQSDICFSHFHETSEGFVERFDCSEEPSKLNKSSCMDILRKSDKSSVCLGDGKETHCCCHSSNPSQICASEKRHTAELTQLWTVSQMWFLIFGHVGLAGIVAVLVFFYMKTVEIWPADNILIPVESRMKNILLAKAVFLLLSLLVIYFPFRKKCMNHPKGSFATPRLFLYQIFEASLGPSLYFSFPLIFFLFDFSFFVYINSVKFINKSGALALSIFKLVTVPLFVYECFLSTIDLWDKDHEPGYCRLNGAIWQFMLSHFFILVYHILIIIQTVLLSKMRRNLDFTQRNSDETHSHVATVMSTNTGETRIESEYSEMVYIHPRVRMNSDRRNSELYVQPFNVPRLGMNVLTVKNNRMNEWLSLRALLSTTGFYKLYPSKFVIPPGKEISIEVEQCTRADSPTLHHNILIEWLSLIFIS